MEAFYEGEEKGENDRKEEGTVVKPWGWFFCVLTLMYYMAALFEEITYYILQLLKCADAEHGWTRWEK